jgi:hypothetical protein
MGYLNNFLGIRCWRCKQGQIELLDKNYGVYLACSSYPASCQFVSAAPIQCPHCAGGSLISKFEEDILYLVHDDCGFKSETPAWALRGLHRKTQNWTMREIPSKHTQSFEPFQYLDCDSKNLNEVNQFKDAGVLIDYLTTLSFEELNQLWDSEAWESPENLPIPDSLDELTVKETIQKIRSIKWKLLKNKPSSSD